MSHIEIKACQLREEAERKVKSLSFLSSFFSKSEDKTRESIEYYIRAGNLFKMVLNWSQAATAFTDAANLCRKVNDVEEAAFNYVEAAACYKMFDISKAVEAYKEVVKIYRNNGKFNAAARYCQAIGKLFQGDSDNENAVKYFEEAASFYKRANKHSAANKCLEIVAEVAALSEDYHKAIKIFEEIACFDLASSVLKHQAKQYFFRAAICLLCAGINVIRKLKVYTSMHPAFLESKEYKFILCLSKCINEKNLEVYENTVRTFDTISGLRQWHVTMLLRIKNQLEKKV